MCVLDYAKCVLLILAPSSFLSTLDGPVPVFEIHITRSSSPLSSSAFLSLCSITALFSLAS